MKKTVLLAAAMALLSSPLIADPQASTPPAKSEGSQAQRSKRGTQSQRRNRRQRRRNRRRNRRNRKAAVVYPNPGLPAGAPLNPPAFAGE